MNDQTQDNSTYDLYSVILSSLNVNKYTDVLFLYVIIPLASLGTVFNSISFGIFCKKSFNKVHLFKYFRVYTFTSLIVSSSLIFSFYFSLHTLRELVSAYSARLYICKIVPSYVSIFFFFYGNCLDIFINIERASNFSYRFSGFKKISPYFICLILFLVCVLINGPNYFLYDIIEDDQTQIRFDCKWSQFTWSPLGKLLLMISFIIQGPVVLIMAILSNLIAIFSYRRFLKRKALIVNHEANKNKGHESAQMKKDEKINKKLLFMTIYLNGLSIGYHLIELSAKFILFWFDTSASLAAWFVFIGILMFALKNFLNIFFFYKYNYQFRNALIFCGKELFNENGTSINRTK